MPTRAPLEARERGRRDADIALLLPRAIAAPDLRAVVLGTSVAWRGSLRLRGSKTDRSGFHGNHRSRRARGPRLPVAQHDGNAQDPPTFFARPLGSEPTRMDHRAR